MKRVRNRLFREAFSAALRVFRTTLLDDPDVAALRAWADALDRALAQDEPGTTTRVLTLPRCTATWFDIAGADPRRVLLYLHGGAFVIETPRLYSAFVARLARDGGLHALMPHYRLAPEHPFPAAPDDALAAYRWLLAAGFQPRDIVVAGDSSGGNLALGLLQRLEHEGLALPACALAISPLTDGTFSGDSMRRNDGQDPMFTLRGFERLAPLYLPDANSRRLPLASPLFGRLENMPPTLLTVGSSELLLDDAVRFALRCPGSQLQVWHDMPHVFPLFKFLPEAQEARRGMVRFIAAELGRPKAHDISTQRQGAEHGAEVQRVDREGFRPLDKPEVAGGTQLGAGRVVSEGYGEEIVQGGHAVDDPSRPA